jgi:crotonobetainyl-CoA:carnitine CoA-transferase CaiB-like acyl-CoA transferase
MSGVLQGIRVLDFGRYIAGPYCACLLGDMGAEVIRIEKLTGSEDRYIASIGSGGEGALYIAVNRNKKSMTLNPTKPAGREVVKKLVATADVVVANLPPATLQQMGLDYDTLVQSKPDIILTTANAYGSGGPSSNRVGFDGIGQVMCGNAYLSGEDGTPTKAWVPWVDFGTASLSAFGTMAALMSRAQTGKGQKVEGALLKTALTFMNATTVEQAVTQIDRKATGNRGQNAAPSDIFQTKDGWIISQVIGQPLYERWAKLMGEEHWLTDARFKDDDSRGAHGEVISARMSAWCAERTTEEALQTLEAARIPGGPVYSPQQALEDPHIQAMGFLQPTAYPGLPKPAPLANIPVTLSDTPGSIRMRAPLLGEHTDEVMCSLGYDTAEIAALRDQRVI